ncbi:MAG: hypothetical protein ABIA76_03765 [Candidatus Diapherotrites archaeon]
MFKSLQAGLTELIKRPLLVLLSAFFFVIQFLALWLVLDSFLELFVFFLFPAVDLSFEFIPFFLLMNYPFELFALLLQLLFSLFLFSWLYNSMAIALIEDIPSIKAVINSLDLWKKHLGLGIFYFCTALIYFTALFLLLWIASAFDSELLFLFFLILFFALGFFGLLIAYKFVFIPVALVREPNAKKAIQLSWKFTSKQFFTGIALFLIVFMVFYLISGIGYELSLLVEDELISSIVFILLNSVGLTYALLVLIEFFEKKK